MQELMLPVRHDWLARERAYGKIAIEPFEPGFALTAGNAYRRVLLSSITGAAPTWVKIEGVLHEFSHLVGLREDTLDIILNLRKLVFTLHVNRPKLLRLKAQGVRTVTARDFEPDPDVEILTPDVALATLDKDGSLEMEVCVERGRGYQPAEKREPEALPINAMLMDSDFSPVKRVNFQVEAKGAQERLILEVWTNGNGDAGGRGGRRLAHSRRPVRAADRLPGLRRRCSPRAPRPSRASPSPKSEVNEHLFRNVDELEAVGARVQLPQDRQHPHHRGSRAEDRSPRR